MYREQERRANLPARVAENDGLCDSQRVVQVAQRVELPLLTLDCHEELLDAFQRQLITATLYIPRRIMHNILLLISNKI